MAVERRRSFWLVSCFVLARGRMATDGSPPGSTITLTLETSTSSRAVVDESIVTWNEYCPGGSELAGTVYEHPLVDVVRKEQPNEHSHLKSSEPQSVQPARGQQPATSGCHQ